MSKYGNKSVLYDGHFFDSKKEAKRYTQLKLLERAGKIEHLALQPEFELIPAFEKNGRKYRRRIYKADFSYFDVEQGKNVIEDVKGFKTDFYRLKKTLFEYKYPDLEIIEVTEV